MQTISVGDLYFLGSPFHCTEGTSAQAAAAQEKELSYILGTVSSRPAVVVRAPAWWDRYNTVTVIPALTKGRPALVLHLLDMYGRKTDAAYPFLPHNPHTIPVSRLGRRIGSLSHDELEELLYAFKWIHDPDMQADRKQPIPGVYKGVFEEKSIPQSWKTNRDIRARADLMIMSDTMKLRSNAVPSLNGFPIGDCLPKDYPDQVQEALEEDVPYEVTESPLPDAVESEDDTAQIEAQLGLIRSNGERALDDLDDEIEPDESPLEEEDKTAESDPEESTKPPVVPVEKEFPESIFAKATLMQIAGRFDISNDYYTNNVQKRDPKYLTVEEIRTIRGPLTDRELDEIFEYYKILTPLDAFILWPRIPTSVLRDISGFNPTMTAAIKRLSNVMRDIHQDNYDGRVESERLRIEKEKAEKKATREQAKMDRAKKKEDQAAKLEIIRKYLDMTHIYDMTTYEEVKAFLDLPQGVISRAWRGLNFKQSYTNAKSFYKRGMKIYDECIKAAENIDEDVLKEAGLKLLKVLEELQSGDEEED